MHIDPEQGKDGAKKTDPSQHPDVSRGISTHRPENTEQNGLKEEKKVQPVVEDIVFMKAMLPAAVQGVVTDFFGFRHWVHPLHCGSES
ncbi:MAG: hypothetical protein WAM82_31065 [Thermoanaerobaculia bacterium]